ncbi:MAG: Unknown protein [uncultured Sulfurovum sp.]|uniref:Uncharacterized protein n=1 Tax=uncultured Sulfurovum sp. TaxID=269237 RepID=A0A6S6RUQ6_9BACT|nr:MAG: Unknown protein [uncultured Sulfurovum sp.]
MTHIQLIEFIYTHRHTLDDIYKSKKSTVTETLENSRLITKIGDNIELSESYRNFIDITLNRIDYAVIFNTYNAELQELLKQKTRYLEEKNPYYLEEILALLKTIFLKLNQRDQEIRTLLIKIENETSLDLDLLIEKSMDILEKIEEVNRANNEVREIFYNDIYHLDPTTKYFIDEVSSSLLLFVENISESLHRLKQFIARTRKLRLQNRQLHQLSTQILEEKDQELEDVLMLEPQSYYLTLYRSQKNSIKSFPDGSENSKVIRKLRIYLNEVQVPKEPTQFNIRPQKEEHLNLVNIKAIEDELREKGTEDIFNFIYEHQALKNFIENSEKELSLKEESFKIYLQFIIPHNEHIELKKHYNNHAIRIAQWI